MMDETKVKKENKLNLGLSKKRKILLAVSLTSLTIMALFIVISSISSNQVKDKRDISLDLYEYTKTWVLEDMRQTLLVKNAETWKAAKADTHMSTDLKNIIFKAKYESMDFGQATNVSYIDAQYSIDDKDKILIYILANVKTQDGAKALNMVVTVKDNIMTDILAY